MKAPAQRVSNALELLRGLSDCMDSPNALTGYQADPVRLTSDAGSIAENVRRIEAALVELGVQLPPHDFGAPQASTPHPGRGLKRLSGEAAFMPHHTRTITLTIDCPDDATADKALAACVADLQSNVDYGMDDIPEDAHVTVATTAPAT